jgi:hypothetical protein
MPEKFSIASLFAALRFAQDDELTRRMRVGPKRKAEQIRPAGNMEVDTKSQALLAIALVRTTGLPAHIAP